MAAGPGDGKNRNQKLINARLRLKSPSGSGETMSTQEVAEGMNIYLWEDYLKVKGTPKPTVLDHRFVSTYEAGRAWWPSLHYRAAFRAVLQVATDAELGFHPNRKRRTSNAKSRGDKASLPRAGRVYDEASVATSTHFGVADSSELSEIELFRRGLALGVGRNGRTATDFAREPSQAALEWADRVRRGVNDPARYADAFLVNAFRLQLETAKAIDGCYGARNALSTAQGVIDLVESVAPDAPDEVRDAALALGAETAEFIGWLFRDLASAGQARFWYDRAMEYAQTCGDMAMQGFVLLRRSQMAYESRSGHHVRVFARAAIEGPWQLPPRVHAEALLQVARGNLMMGQSIDMDGAVEQAQEAAGGEDLRLREASCWIEAGKLEHAVQLYEEGLAADGVSVRDQAYFRARQAVALARAAKPDLAAQYAVQALSTSMKTGSLRTRLTVQATHRMLTPWHSSEAVASLGEMLSAPQQPIL